MGGGGVWAVTVSLWWAVARYHFDNADRQVRQLVVVARGDVEHLHRACDRVARTPRRHRVAASEHTVAASTQTDERSLPLRRERQSG